MTVADHIGGPAVLTVTLAGAALSPAQVGPVQIYQGRSDLTQPVEPATCTVTLLTDSLAALPRVGDQLAVALGADTLTYAGLAGAAATAAGPRFTGHVTDVAARPSVPGGVPPTVTVTAAARRSRLARTFVGDTPWPVELDGARASRILALAAPLIGATVGAVDPGTVSVTARDVDRQPALALLDLLALDSGGQLVELRNGTLTWQDAQHRGRGAPVLTLTAAQVLASVVAQQKMAGIVNQLTVAYGPALAGGAARPTVYTQDPPSADPVTGYGPFSATLASQLETQLSAQKFARLTVGRRSRPTWGLTALTVDLIRTVPAATAALLWQLDHASLIAVSGFPTSGPFAAANLWVEGWRESYSRHDWRMELSVSAYGRSGPALRWTDVPATFTWAGVPQDMTWLGAAGWDTSTA